MNIQSILLNFGFVEREAGGFLGDFWKAFSNIRKTK